MFKRPCKEAIQTRMRRQDTVCERANLPNLSKLWGVSRVQEWITTHWHSAFSILAVLHTRTSANFTRVQTPKNKYVQRDAQQRNSLRKPSSGPLILHRLRPLENKIFSGLQSGASCSYIICPKEAARAGQLGARRQDQSDTRQARTGQERQQRKTWR